MLVYYVIQILFSKRTEKETQKRKGFGFGKEKYMVKIQKEIIRIDE